MAALVFISNTQNIVNNTAMKFGNLYHTTDTDKTFYDSANNTRIELTTVTYVSAYSDLIALTITRPRNSLFVVTTTKTFYIFDHNNTWKIITDSYTIPTYLLPYEELTPITLESDGKSYGPRTMLKCVYNSNGESLEDIVNFKDASPTQRGSILLYDDYDSTDINTAPTSNALKKLYEYITGWEFKANDSHALGGLGANMFLQYTPTSDVGGYFDKSSTIPTKTSRLNYSGYLYATRIYNAVYNDYAEYFERNKEDLIEVGDVIVKDKVTGNYTRSITAYDSKVVGVYSGEYGQCLGGKGDGNDEENYIPVGLAGRVHVKTVGAIEIGDLLVSSDIPGVAMKCENYKPGTIIGKCLESKDTEEVSIIQMLIMNA